MIKFVLFFVILFGFNIESLCLCVNFVNGFVWFINWERGFELKNFLIEVVNGFGFINVFICK